MNIYEKGKIFFGNYLNVDNYLQIISNKLFFFLINRAANVKKIFFLNFFKYFQIFPKIASIFKISLGITQTQINSSKLFQINIFVFSELTEMPTLESKI